MNRMTLIVVVVFIILAAGVFAALVIMRATTPPQVTVSPSPTQVAVPTPAGDTTVSSGQEIKNPYKGAKETTVRGDALTVTNDRYQIVYLGQFDEFIIDVLQELFEENRRLAEGDFLQRIGVNERDACFLKVTVNPPIKEGELQPKYRLSFCQ